MAQTIYLVEDDTSISEFVSCACKGYGFSVSQFFCGGDLFLESEKPDLYLLDVMLPDMSGIDILTKIRSTDTKTPIIMLTAKSSEMDRVLGLDLGANDYVTKPFSVLELMARIRANLRTKADTASQDIISVKDISLDVKKHKVISNGKEVDLTLKEFELLKVLLLNKSNISKRDELLDKVWGYNYVGESRTLDIHIGSLRQKLNTKSIITVRGVGYKIEE